MPSMHHLLSLLLVLLFALPTHADESTINAVQSKMDYVVKSVIGKDRRAHEFRAARKIHIFDVDRDGIKDAIAFFTIEGFGGGNNYKFYMSLLKGTATDFTLLDAVMVGEKGTGQPSFDRPDVKFGKLIFIDFLEYDWATDATCCPSKKSKIAFSINGSKLEKLELKRVE